MYRSILMPVDLEQPSSWEKALPTAVALSSAFGASLSLATVVPERAVMFEAQWSPIAQREMLEQARARLGSLASSVEGAGEVAHHVEIGGIYSTILSIGERIRADLIVLSSHRPAMRDYLLGANASRVVRHARCSVFVVRHAVPDAD
jgi:nucleotide-binding universal stress UspA family protein